MTRYSLCPNSKVSKFNYEIGTQVKPVELIIKKYIINVLPANTCSSRN